MEDLFPLESSWIVAVAAGVIAFLMLRRLAKPLPLQNVALIAVCLFVGEGLIQWLVDAKITKVDMPDARWRYLAGSALLWMTVALTMRRVAKLIARPWRKEKVHWIWVLGLSGLGTALFQIGWPLLDPDFNLQKKVMLMVAVRGGGTVVLLGCLAPWFIRKRPHPGKDFSELPDQPEDETEQDAEEKTSG